MPDDGIYKQLLARLDAEKSVLSEAVRDGLLEMAASEARTRAMRDESVRNNADATEAKANTATALQEVRAELAEFTAQAERVGAEQAAAVRDAIAAIPAPSAAPAPVDVSGLVKAVSELTKRVDAMAKSQKVAAPVSPAPAREYVIEVIRDGADQMKRLVLKPK